MKLMYLHDVLCGWCMVASAPLADLEEALPAQVSVQYKHVNLFDADFSPVLDDAFLAKVREVGTELAPQKTGVHFDERYLQWLASPDTVHRSDKAHRAIAAVELIDPNAVRPFSKALQAGVFGRGLDPNSDRAIAQAAESVGLDLAALKAAIGSEASKLRARKIKREGRLLMAYRQGGVPQLMLFDGDDALPLDPYDAAESLAAIEKRLPAQALTPTVE